VSTTYHEVRNERRRLLTRTAEKAVQWLPAWHLETFIDHDSVQLVHRDGARVNLSIVTYGANAGKLHATMAHPALYKGDSREQVDASYKEADTYLRSDAYKYPRTTDRFRIAVNLNPERPANALARDLDKRLLVHAVDFHIDAMAAIEEHRTGIDRRTQTVERIIASAPNARKYGDDGVTFGDYNHATVSTNGTVRFTELRCSADDAIRIIDLLNKGA
jgi:hypothetical protein